MKKDYELTQDRLNKFLEWLDSDRESAARKYEEIRLRLVKIFNYRRCLSSDELADETIDRVIRKIDDLAEGYDGDPALYFYRVANYVYLEYLRQPKNKELPLDIDVVQSSFNEDLEADIRNHCYRLCLEKLSPEDRLLIINYYSHKKDNKELKKDYDLTPSGLRMKVFRIRNRLADCLKKCMSEKKV